MKNRTLSAELITSAPFLDLPEEQQILYLALLCHADDDGLMRNNLTEITAKCRPLTPRATVASQIGQLIDAGFLVPVKEYIAIAGFKIHQRIPKPRPQHFKTGLPKDLATIVTKGPDHRRQALPSAMKTCRESPDREQVNEIAQDVRKQSLVSRSYDDKYKAQHPEPFAIANADAVKNTMQTDQIEPVSREMWEARIENFRNRGVWLKHYGPKPGQPGCIVPEDLV